MTSEALLWDFFVTVMFISGPVAFLVLRAYRRRAPRSVRVLAE